MAWLENKKKKNNTVENNDNLDWNKDLKRNIVNKTGVKQQGLYFEDNADLKVKKSNIGTKKGPSFNIENITPSQIEVLKNCQSESTAAELINILERTNKTKFKQTVLHPLIDCGFFELSIPDKPKSPKQRYRLTGKFVAKNTNF